MKKPKIPPTSLMFMGESTEKFISIGDYHLNKAIGRIKSLQSKVIDIGCGYGRLAYALDRRDFRGKYYGLDILKNHITWLQKNFTSVLPEYTFIHVDVKNDRYNKTGSISPKDFYLPPEFQSPDLVLVLSVFTHMYEDDISTYLNQIKAIMANHTLLYFTCFLLNSPANRPYLFEFKLNDHCQYFSEEDPLHAIAYDEAWLRNLLLSHGLVPEIEYGYQDHVFAHLAAKK